VAVRMLDLPPSDRPRERMVRVGLGGLSDAELLALIIRTGTRGRSVLSVASELLSKFGSLAALSVARPEEIQRIASLGEAKASELVAAFEIGRRSATDEELPSRISRPQDIVRAVSPMLLHSAHEEVVLVVANRASRAIKVERLAQGWTDHAHLPTRDALSSALRNGGAAIALAHTHPSGDVRPSPEDVAVTRSIKRAAQLVGLEVIDHVIIANGRWRSLRDMDVL
jgi:DNA repair protein RadC